MCGIAGIINFSEKEVEDKDLHFLSASLKERGPDYSGLWKNNNVGFVHTRLSILDISNAGNQPMHFNDCSITFNGEIYNFKIIREELVKLGFTFFSNSDTEVILKGYNAWGIDALLNKLDGMFAFCLYDKKNSEAFFCRDRLGKKPFYFFKNRERLIFSSEIRGICALENNLTIDFESLDYYLTELSVPQPQTIFNEIKQVEPGSYLSLNIINATITNTKYYQFSIHRDDNNRDESNVLKELENKLNNAVIKRTISDVPIGCFLSGGVDSGLIVSTLAMHSNERVDTFSIGFGDKEYSELELANLVAKKYNTKHHELVVEPKNVSDTLVELLNYIAEPFADPSIIPTYLVCNQISKHVKVALSGDGGDEVFGGYGEFLTAYNTDKFVKQNPSENMRKTKAMGNSIGSKLGLPNNKNALYQSYSKMNGAQKISRYMGYDTIEKSQLYHSNLKNNKSFGEAILNNIWSKHKMPDSVDTLFLSSLDTRLLSGYLVKVDRMSMKNGLEVRSPFLDKDLMEYAFRINSHVLFGNGKSAKYLLKKLVEKRYDPNIFTREKKGFELPIKKWMKTDLRSMIQDILFSEAFKNRAIFNQTYVEKLVNEHLNDKVDNTYKIWILLCLELWFRGLKQNLNT
jgi:asparagine synthase (glutamine-hydrolysing)